MPNKEVVVLVHGLAGSRLDMWPISRRLRRVGFETTTWSYRSIGNDIKTHGLRLSETLSSIDSQVQDGRFHLVTHSMGGIIARTVFERMQFRNLGRVVMLAPPHHGSHAARKLAPYFGWLTPSLQQLSDAPDSFVNKLPNSMLEHRIEFGIVEASKDRVIANDSVSLDGFRDFAKVDGHHGVLTWYPQTIRFVESFLIHGSFSEERKQARKSPQSEASNEGLRLTRSF